MTVRNITSSLFAFSFFSVRLSLHSENTVNQQTHKLSCFRKLK